MDFLTLMNKKGLDPFLTRTHILDLGAILNQKSLVHGKFNSTTSKQTATNC